MRRNPVDWLQAADAEIEADGTEGAFTRQARRAGYSDTLDYAAQVKEDYERWVHLGEPGRAPYVLKTYRRATFALNAQKRNPRKPVQTVTLQDGQTIRIGAPATLVEGSARTEIRITGWSPSGKTLHFQRASVRSFDHEVASWRPSPQAYKTGRRAPHGVVVFPRRNPRRSTGGAYRTKAGEHGTLYLWRIPWRDRDPGNVPGSVSAWAYDSEHAIEEAIGNLDGNGWEYESDYTLGRPKRAKA